MYVCGCVLARIAPFVGHPRRDAVPGGRLDAGGRCAGLDLGAGLDAGGRCAGPPVSSGLAVLNADASSLFESIMLPFFILLFV